MQNTARDFQIGVGIMLFALFMLFILIPMQVSVPSSVTIATTAPNYWPRCVCLLLFCLGAFQALLAFAHRRNTPATEDGRRAENKGRIAAMRLALVVVLFAWYFLVGPLGLPAASAAGTPVASWLYGERRVKVLLACALIPPALLHWFFVTVAQSSIEPGVLGILGI